MAKLPIGKKILHIWLCIHFLILLLSYSELTFINNYGKYDLSKFWPAVEYANYQNKFIPTRKLGPEMGYGTEGYESKEKEMTAFYGIFNNYDYTEFLAYSLLGIIVFAISRRKDESTEIKEDVVIQEQKIDTVSN